MKVSQPPECLHKLSAEHSAVQTSVVQDVVWPWPGTVPMACDFIYQLLALYQYSQIPTGF